MNNQNQESFSIRIWFTEQDIYIKNREEFENLKIEKHKEDNSQFIKVEDTVVLNGIPHKVKQIVFRLEHDDTMMYNSQIQIFAVPV